MSWSTYGKKRAQTALKFDKSANIIGAFKKSAVVDPSVQPKTAKEKQQTKTPQSQVAPAPATAPAPAQNTSPQDYTNVVNLKNFHPNTAWKNWATRAEPDDYLAMRTIERLKQKLDIDKAFTSTGTVVLESTEDGWLKESKDGAVVYHEVDLNECLEKIRSANAGNKRDKGYGHMKEARERLKSLPEQVAATYGLKVGDAAKPVALYDNQGKVWGALGFNVVDCDSALVKKRLLGKRDNLHITAVRKDADDYIVAEWDFDSDKIRFALGDNSSGTMTRKATNELAEVLVSTIFHIASTRGIRTLEDKTPVYG